MENGEWTATSRIINEYNASGKITLKSDQVWREDFQDWGNRRSIEYTYDAAGNEIESIDTWWDFETLIFSESLRDEREYDQNNNLIQYTYSKALIPGQFFPFSRSTYTYDYDYRGEDIVPTTQGNMLLKNYQERWNADLNDWVFYEESIYEYSPAEIRTLPDLDVNYVCSNVHPNPATNYITFRVVGASTPVRIHLFDANGKALGEEILGDGNTLAVSHLQRGVYFYQLFYNQVREGGKFMIK